MPVPELNTAGGQIEPGLKPLIYEGHFPDAPCVSSKLEEFVSSEALDRLEEETRKTRGSTLHRSLQIDFLPDSDDPEVMESLDSGYYSDHPFHAIDVTLVEGSNRVYRAHIGALPAPYQTVALKFAFTEEERTALETEAAFYQNELRRVQKFIVPLYIGFFGTSNEEYEDQVSCLVTRFVGEPITCAFEQLPAQERMWVFKTVDALHACGLRHNDLRERNIRIDRKTERAWIVDFETAEKHKCKHQPVAVGDVEPSFWKFGCPELFELAVVVKIWVTLGNLPFCVRNVPLKSISRWQDLIPYTFGDWAQEKKEELSKAQFRCLHSIIDQKFEEYYEANRDWYPERSKKSSKESED